MMENQLGLITKPQTGGQSSHRRSFPLKTQARLLHYIDFDEEIHTCSISFHAYWLEIQAGGQYVPQGSILSPIMFVS